jgi:hypothetical protein
MSAFTANGISNDVADAAFRRAEACSQLSWPNPRRCADVRNSDGSIPYTF